MAKPFLHLEDHLLMLNEYAPYKVAMQMPHHTTPWFILVGVDFAQQSALVTLGDAGGQTSIMLVNEAQPVLYSLADLPNLPGGNSHQSSPVGVFLQMLNFIERGDNASGEWVNQVTVKSRSDASLTLAFSTIYHPDTSNWSDDDFNDESEPEDNAGADYEVSVSATGTIYWRNVTADALEGERVHHWRIVEGVHVFEAFRYLRKLHVAVGKVAYIHQEWSNATNSHTPHYSYVRKQLPAVKEGGQADA